MKKKIEQIFLAIFMLIFSCNSEKENTTVMAKVGETTLTLEQISIEIGLPGDTLTFNEDLEKYIRRWVEEEVIYQAGVAEGLASLPEIQDELRALRRTLIINYYLEKKLADVPEFSENDIFSYYEKHKDDFTREETEFKYSFLICKNRTIARSLLRDVRRDSSFEKIIEKNYPENVLNKTWDSEYVALERVIPSIQKNIVQVRPGTSYGPVASESGQIIFKLEEKHEAGSLRDISLVKDIIKLRLQEEWFGEQYQQLLVSLRNEKPIVIK